MVEKSDVARDFGFLKDRVLAVLIFGSSVKGKGRDVDVCIVAKDDPKKILKEVFSKVDASKYDVWIFEELPLYMKIEVIENHEIVFCKDELELYEYFYQFRKLWKDQKRRNTLSKEELKAMLSK
ncbi:DNA polymerase beta domain protein region [Ferroglobus placidus DSM 10642]|uniref:DNA polymerase beta domain protein region n=1 Tax=Ferroglobus placidus (strain DSM 10642 / AEDII12DO) TaxID=589924 RepID=D3RZT8_FERPA|nr:nucleotidyltransferase domain-containing protein [Ferroglobus placidus]ADC66001.1 DNA polymerase beta domain protein region [Ferroglobus placidus DSM 10642]